MIHELKCLSEPFAALRSGVKTFEFRKDDRTPRFEVGDGLMLEEWNPNAPGAGYTHEREWRIVTYITRGDKYGIPPGYCVMSVKTEETMHDTDLETTIGAHTSHAALVAEIVELRARNKVWSASNAAWQADCARRDAENGRLCTDNARLRQIAQDNAAVVVENTAELKAENARLADLYESERRCCDLRERVAAELRDQLRAAQDRVADYEDDARKVSAEQCAPDEQHCSCVPHLRKALATSQAEARELAGWFNNNTVFLTNECGKGIVPLILLARAVLSRETPQPATVAQSAEHPACIRDVGGSTPPGGSTDHDAEIYDAAIEVAIAIIDDDNLSAEYGSRVTYREILIERLSTLKKGAKHETDCKSK